VWLAWSELDGVKSGNANLPAAAGGFRSANREIGVPRQNRRTIPIPFESPGSSVRIIRRG
jgi:hypothetical protein